MIISIAGRDMSWVQMSPYHFTTGANLGQAVAGYGAGHLTMTLYRKDTNKTYIEILRADQFIYLKSLKGFCIIGKAGISCPREGQRWTKQREIDRHLDRQNYFLYFLSCFYV